VDSNLSAFDMPDFTAAQLQAVQEVYEKFIKQSVHQLW
jgi:hypothetical protein